MPSVTYNGQSFAIDGRRLWILGASIEYARVPSAMWAERIAAARQAGFNTIATACPWAVHEPRRGRYHFQGDADIRRFIETCAAAGMRVILRAGPYVGDGFDGGGLPGWLIETPEIALREGNEVFLEDVSQYFRKLLAEVTDLQATTGGPLLLVQSEHAWTCSNDDQAERYLHEITRFIRESGITVPIINANDLWQESPGTIDTWRGYHDLLAHLRQLRSVQPGAPRLVTEFHAARVETWGGSGRRRGAGEGGDAREERSPQQVLRHLAEILASGAQPIVSPFHGGTNFGFLGGRLAGRPDGFVTTAAAFDAPLAEGGTRGERYHAIRRLVTFASHFGSVFAELEPDYQPIVLDPSAGSSKVAHGEPDRTSVVPLRGPQGRIVFVFGAPGRSSSATLILDDGVRLPVSLGDQSVGWFALDVDLQGLGRLDYSSVCPWAIVDRSIVVFQGPPGATVYMSINGTPLDATVPVAGASKPLVMEHKGLTIVVCSQEQIDVTYHDATAVYVGIGGFDAHGAPMPSARERATGSGKAWVIRKDANVHSLSFTNGDGGSGGGGGGGGGKKHGKDRARAPKHGTGTIKLVEWQISSCESYVSGESPRYASLEGPAPLSECGAPSGYGWYRMAVEGAGRKLIHMPQAADRVHLFVEGAPAHLFGVGPAAHLEPFELKLGKGRQNLVALVDNLGRFSEGNDLQQIKGIHGHIYEVRPMRSAKAKAIAGKPVDPFELRGFIAGRGAGQLSDTRQAAWTFEHAKKNAIIVSVTGALASGTFVLNDQPLSYYAGSTGACFDNIVIDPKSSRGFRRGKNVLRFAPDLRQDDAVEEISRATALYECQEAVTDGTGASWAFAKWEPPPQAAYVPVGRGGAKPARKLPCWWRATFDAPAGHGHEPAIPLWLDTKGLSKGQAFVNGQNVGRYFTSTASGKEVGPQTQLYVPACWLRTGGTGSGGLNELVLFDEHGFEPGHVGLVHRGEE